MKEGYTAAAAEDLAQRTLETQRRRQAALETQAEADRIAAENRVENKRKKQERAARIAKNKATKESKAVQRA